MKTIIVASDLSPRSDRALHRALHLGASFGAHVRVVSVVDDAMPEDMVAALKENVANRLSGHIDSLGIGVEVSVSVLDGDPVEEIVEFATAHEADLLVLGLHRRRAFLDRMRESTSELIVAASIVPVLIVKDLRDGPYDTILAPISFSHACAAAIRAAARLAPGAAIHAYHAMHVPFAGLTGGTEGSDMERAVRRETEERASLWMQSERLPEGLAAPEIIIGAVGQTLSDQVAHIAPDLIACGTHTRGIALHELGAFAADLLRDPPADLLVSPPTTA